MKKSYMAIAAAAIAAGLSAAAPPITLGPDSTSMLPRRRRRYTQGRRHLTKKGPGRGGHKGIVRTFDRSKHCVLMIGGDFRYIGTGKPYPLDYKWACTPGTEDRVVRNKRKLLGTRG